MAVLLPFALRLADNRYVDATDVPSGRACGCICPQCRQPLIARHQRHSQRTSHFAHEPGAECAGAWETAVHKTAKQIVADAPALNLRLGDSGFRWQIEFDEAHVERPMIGFTPDVLVRHQSGPALAVEILVTHQVDQTKQEKIRSARLTCVEIDLSRAPRRISYDELRRRICEGSFPARLVHNEIAGLQRALDAAEAFRHPRRFKRQQEEAAAQAAQQVEQQRKQEAWREKAPWLRP